MATQFRAQRRAVRILLALATFSPAIALADAPATQPTTRPAIETVADHHAVDSADIDHSLVDHWLSIDLDAGQKVTVWGVPLTAVQPSKALVGSNSTYQFCVVIAGRIQREDLSAPAGHVIFWSLSPGSRAREMEYSGRDFQKSMQAIKRDDLADALNDFTASQDTRRWWGLVRPVNVNIGAPLKSSVDATRKSYLMQPEVIRVRQKAANTGDLPAQTAWAMVADLKAQKTDEVAQLLSPEWFIEPAKRGELDQARKTVAGTLVGQAWTKQINDDSVRATDDPLQFHFSAGKQSFVMTLKPFDDMVYVLSIVPEESK